jgi:hypothetical protein
MVGVGECAKHLVIMADTSRDSTESLLQIYTPTYQRIDSSHEHMNASILLIYQNDCDELAKRES